MADFSFLSDTDDSAVEEIISEAVDHCTLKQIAAINCSSFSDDSLLPPHLESRFRRLKTFPPPPTSSTPTSPPPAAPPSLQTSKPQSSDERKNDESNSANSFHRAPNSSSPVRCEKAPKLDSGHSSSPSVSADSSPGNRSFSKSRANPPQGKGFDAKLRSGSFSPGSNSSSSSRETASPPRRNGCFCCSPKTKGVFGRKFGKGNGAGDLGEKDGIFTDLGSLSRKEQSKVLKKALEEEERISREAEKIIKWAKQASMKIDFAGIDDNELSDH
ncbi:hypothetical protein Dimus_007723 [Dionaea muscipula]